MKKKKPKKKKENKVIEIHIYIHQPCEYPYNPPITIYPGTTPDYPTYPTVTYNC